MALGSGSTLGFLTIALTFIALLIVSQLVLSYTRFGLYIYAIGGDRQAAERMGINVKFVRMSVLVLMAVFTVIGGIVMLGRIASATSPTWARVCCSRPSPRSSSAGRTSSAARGT